MNDDDLKQLWRNQAMATTTFSLDDLKAEARRMHRRITLRNALEYAACILVLGVFALYMRAFPHPLMRIGSSLIIIATLFVAWQLRRRASSQALPPDRGGQSWLEFQRTQLVRQRDALRSAWLWYVAPFVPGVVAFRWGVETELGAGAPFARGWWCNAIVAVIFLGVAALNRYGARKLQQRNRPA